MKYTDEYKHAAYKVATTCKDVTKLTNDEIKAAKSAADDYKWYAQMSDDYRRTQAELRQIADEMREVYKEAKRRGI